MLLNDLMPEVHGLGFFDEQNIKNKTSAKLLSDKFILKYIINKQLENGLIERIKFKEINSDKEWVVYRSLIVTSDTADSDVEHIKLQID